VLQGTRCISFPDSYGVRFLPASSWGKFYVSFVIVVVMLV
jgi:hypothetical protein